MSIRLCPDSILQRIEQPRRPGVGVAGRSGLEGEPSSEGLPQSETATVELERVKEETRPTDITDSLYENYKPKKAIIKGSKPHPGPIVESAAMAIVKLTHYWNLGGR